MSNQNNIKQKLDSKIINLIDGRRVEDAEEQVNFIHSQNAKDNCYIAIGTRHDPKVFQQWHVQHKELDWDTLSNLLGLTDLYMSISSSWKCSRKLNNIRRLNAFWIDLDYYNIPKYKNKTTEEMISILRKDKMFKDLEPSFFIDSGKGMYIFYLIDSCPKQILGYWQTIQNALCKRFEDYGADAKSTDAVHILRLAGSINSKTNRVARLIYNTNSILNYIAKQEPMRRYSINEIGNILLPPLKYTREEWQELKNSKNKTKKQIKTNRESRKVQTFMSLHNLHFKRMSDIEKLIELKEGNCEGTREFMCFLYRYFNCCYYKDPSNAIETIKELNNSFTDPLTDSELIKATSSAEGGWKLWQQTYEEYSNLEDPVNITQFFRKRGCYIYSNKKLIEILKITQVEMESLETIINTQEKNRRSKDYRSDYYKENKERYNKNRREKRRNEEGLTKREQEKLEKMQQIEELIKEGLKQKDIAKKLNISKSLVSMYVKELRDYDVNRENKTTTEQYIDFDINDRFVRVDTSDVQVIIC